MIAKGLIMDIREGIHRDALRVWNSFIFLIGYLSSFRILTGYSNNSQSEKFFFRIILHCDFVTWWVVYYLLNVFPRHSFAFNALKCKNKAQLNLAIQKNTLSHVFLPFSFCLRIFPLHFLKKRYQLCALLNNLLVILAFGFYIKKIFFYLHYQLFFRKVFCMKLHCSLYT